MSDYIGAELGLFQHATNWKRYYGKMVGPFLGREVLEVGAGLGANVPLFYQGAPQRYVCLEPDAGLAAQIRAKVAAGRLPPDCEVVEGTLDSLPPGARFASLLYVDVLEHIEDDRAEMRRAWARLRPGGHLVVLAPAHAFLFSPFDASIGHYRRYSRAALAALVPAARVRLRYLDSLGLLLSLGNRLLLRQPMPTLRQILFWDKRVIPISRLLDPLLGFTIGKSVLGIWKKPSENAPPPAERAG
jgi:SAM-dependent methyltransferase